MGRFHSQFWLCIARWNYGFDWWIMFFSCWCSIKRLSRAGPFYNFGMPVPSPRLILYPSDSYPKRFCQTPFCPPLKERREGKGNCIPTESSTTAAISVILALLTLRIYFCEYYTLYTVKHIFLCVIPALHKALDVWLIFIIVPFDMLVIWVLIFVIWNKARARGWNRIWYN